MRQSKILKEDEIVERAYLHLPLEVGAEVGKVNSQAKAWPVHFDTMDSMGRLMWT